MGLGVGLYQFIDSAIVERIANLFRLVATVDSIVALGVLFSLRRIVSTGGRGPEP